MADEVKAKVVKKEYDPAAPNAHLDLTGFDYSKMTGQAFIDYNKLIASLPNHKLFDFKVMRVEAIKEERYEGIEGSPRDVVGFKITNNEPIQSFTRVTTKQAIEMNGILDEKLHSKKGLCNIVGGQFQHNNRYFLLIQM